jgi:hypothetical protein
MSCIIAEYFINILSSPPNEEKSFPRIVNFTTQSCSKVLAIIIIMWPTHNHALTLVS